MPKRPVTAVIVGAGSRGMGYSAYALARPDELQIVAVAEPSDRRRKIAADRFAIPPNRLFASAGELAARPQMADAAINGTMDMHHVDTAVPLLAAGYHVLLEKPFATSEQDMWRLIHASRKHDRKLMICHVLRYAPFYRAIKERVADGQIGDIVNVQTNEHIGYIHMAMAFVRGQWHRRAQTGSALLMAKCCHDLDLIMWMKSGVSPAAVSSFGSTIQFRPDKAPPGAGTRCIVDCQIEPDCIYSARKHYIDREDPWGEYVWRTLDNPNPTPEERVELLKTSIFGRCVWRAGKDTVDHQSVAIEFEDGATASHNMVGGMARALRTIHVLGTHGEIYGVFEDSAFTVRRPDPSQPTGYSEETVNLNVTGDMHGARGGHGGGDQRLVADFVRFVSGEPPSISCTTIEDSISGHLTGFRADQAMRERRVVTLQAQE